MQQQQQQPPAARPSRNTEVCCQHSPLWAAEAALNAASDTTTSGSEQISDYEPVQARIRDSMSSEESNSRSSLGSPSDWQVPLRPTTAGLGRHLLPCACLLSIQLCCWRSTELAAFTAQPRQCLERLSSVLSQAVPGHLPCCIWGSALTLNVTGPPQEDGSGLSPPAGLRGAASEYTDGMTVFKLTCGDPGCCVSLRLRPEHLGLEPVTLESVSMREVRAVLSGGRAGSGLSHVGLQAPSQASRIALHRLRMCG